MSVFLMGLHDPSTGKFCTVAKCGNGHDDATIARLQDELDMVKISKVRVFCSAYVHILLWILFSGCFKSPFLAAS